MSHSTVLVVIKGATSADDAENQLEDLLEPFNENMEIDPPYVQWAGDKEVQAAVKYFKENPDKCDGRDEAPAQPFDKYEADPGGQVEWTRQALGAYECSDTARGVYDPVEDRYGTLSTYNPKSRWDWYSLGGRWNGFFQLKDGVQVGGFPLPEWRKKLGVVGKDDGRVEGSSQLETFDGRQDAILGGSGVFGNPAEENFTGRADLARKGDIDFDAMRTLAGAKAEIDYDAFEKATKGIEVAKSFAEVTKEVFEKHGVEEKGPNTENFLLNASPEEIQAWRAEREPIVTEARSAYHAQPWIVALRENKLDNFFGDPIEDWCVNTGGRAAYVQKAVDSALATFAVLIDGEWHERGHMGWFGMASDEKDSGSWEAEQRKLLDGLSDDTYLALVDVHI